MNTRTIPQTAQAPDSVRDLELLVRSRVPIIVVETHDEQRILRLLEHVALKVGLPFFLWTLTEGLKRLDRDFAPQKHNTEPAAVLGHIKGSELPAIYALADFHDFLDEAIHKRLIKDIALDSDHRNVTLVLLSHRIELPEELSRFSAQLSLPLPDEQGIRSLVTEIVEEWRGGNHRSRVQADRQAFESLIENLRGLPAIDARRLARNAIYDDGAITASDLPTVMQAKYRLLERDGVLSFEYDTAQFAEIGGLEALKGWIRSRRAGFLRTTGHPPIDSPKGVLLLGVQGCGKSLAAKSVAGVFGVPLLRLDFGSLYNKYYGETERNLREALGTAEVMAPCVLWMDEIEKGIAADQGEGGPSRRILGNLLTWMAEKKARVFVVATANDISALPPELVRKGRFDEIFFIDLPSLAARELILRIHLKRRGHDADRFDLPLLARETGGFTGAELEQAIVAATYAALGEDSALTVDHVRDEIRRTRPLSVVMAEPIAALRAWAADRTVSADGPP